jgi:hypothetical protein
LRYAWLDPAPSAPAIPSVPFYLLPSSSFPLTVFGLSAFRSTSTAS